MLLELGFPCVTVGRIMECVSTVTYSVLVNGFPLAPFKAKNGLR